MRTLLLSLFLSAISLFAQIGPVGPGGTGGSTGATGATGPTGGSGVALLQSGAVTGNCTTDSNQTYYWNNASGASYAIPTSPTTGCTIILQNNDGSNVFTVSNASAQTVNGQTGALSIAVCGTPTTGCPTKRLSWDAVNSVWIWGNPNGAAGATGATGPTGSGAWTLLSDQTIGSPAASVSFSSIPATYKVLKLFITAVSSAATAGDDTVIAQANGDSGAHYFYQYLRGQNATASAGQPIGLTAGAFVAIIPNVGNAGSVANIPGTAEVTFNGYAGTVFYKTAFSQDQEIAAATLAFFTYDGIAWVWEDTSAINAIALTLTSGSNFVTGSRLTLYGIN